MFYPFLRDDVIAILKEIVERADSFHDIIKGLVEESSNYAIDSDIGFMTCILAPLYQDCWDAVSSRLEESMLTIPVKIYFEGPSWNIEQLERLKQSFQDAIESKPDDWILFHLYALGSFGFPNPESSDYVERAKKLAESNPTILRFLPFVMYTEVYSLRNEGDIQGTIKKCDEALEIAREYDDYYWIATLMLAKANVIKDVDHHKGLEILDELFSYISNRSGRSEAIYLVAITMALPYYAMGEYDMALELLLEDFRITSQFTGSDNLKERYSSASIIAKVYCHLEMPKEALDWLYTHSQDLEFLGEMTNSTAAHAFILLDQLERAAEFLEKTRKAAFLSGYDGDMGMYQMVQGLYYLASGELSIAEDLLQQALHLSDPQFQVSVNMCLKSLTRVEIARVDVKADNDAESSGPWMTRLRKHAYEKNFKGIMMEYHLLKAEYQTIIGENEAAKQTLSDALEITDSLTVKTLRKRIENKLKEIERAPHLKKRKE